MKSIVLGYVFFALIPSLLCAMSEADAEAVAQRQWERLGLDNGESGSPELNAVMRRFVEELLGWDEGLRGIGSPVDDAFVELLKNDPRDLEASLAPLIDPGEHPYWYSQIATGIVIVRGKGEHPAIVDAHLELFDQMILDMGTVPEPKGMAFSGTVSQLLACGNERVLDKIAFYMISDEEKQNRFFSKFKVRDVFVELEKRGHKRHLEVIRTWLDRHGAGAEEWVLKEAHKAIRSIERRERQGAEVERPAKATGWESQNGNAVDARDEAESASRSTIWLLLVGAILLIAALFWSIRGVRQRRSC